MPAPNTLETYWLPLEPLGPYFIPLREWVSASLKPLPNSNFKLAKHERHDGIVQLGGRSYRASVVFSCDEQVHFVQIDQNGTPVGHVDDTIADVSVTTADSYLHGVRLKCSVSESMLPEQEAYLWSQFVDRTFELYHFTDGRKSEIRKSRTRNDLLKSLRVVIVGSAGIGKSTLMRRLALDLADDLKATNANIPVYVALRHWTPNEGIEKLIRRELSAGGTDNLSVNLDRMSRNGRMVYLIDGLDEVPSEHRDDAGKDVRGLANKWPLCRFIVSTRPSQELRRFRESFAECRLLDLTRSEIEEFCTHRLIARSAKFSRGWFTSRLAREPALHRMSGNPLFLSLMLARCLRDSLSPHFIGDALSTFADALIDEWDSVRGVRRSKTSGLSPRMRLAILRTLASGLVRSDREEIDASFFGSHLGDLTVGLAPTDILVRLEEETGLLVRVNDSKWRFLHSALKEFFAASYEADRVGEVEDQGIGVQRRLWRFLCWFASDAGEMIKKLITGRYSPDSVMMATEAMSQNLLVRKEIVLGHALAVLRTIEDQVKELQPSSHSVDGSELRILFDRSSSTKVDEFVRFMNVLGRSRDGVASVEIANRLQLADHEVVRSFANLWAADAPFECHRRDAADDSSVEVVIQISTGAH